MTFAEWFDSLLKQVRARVDPPLPPPPAPRPPAERPARRPDVALAFDLYDWLGWIGRPERKKEGAARIRRAMRAVAPGDLARLDEHFRRSLWNHGIPTGPSWLNPASISDPYAVPRDAAPVDALDLPKAAAPWVLGVLAMHPSGFVREAAVRRLDALRGGDELPFLLLRANDWTPAVRRAAARAVIERAAPEHAERFVRCLPLLIRLEESERKNAEAVVEAVRAVLRTSQARPALVTALRSDDRRVRRRAFALLAERATDEALYELVVSGFTSADLVLRRSAAREARRLDVGRARELLHWLMGAGTGAERVEALAVADKVGAEGEPWIREAARDHRWLVRATARSMLKARGISDFAAFYRKALETESRSLDGALLGLSETGVAEDAAIVERFLAHPRVRVRAAAVEALLRLRRDEALPLVVPMLADASAYVSRATRRALERRPVPRSALAALFEGGHPAYVRANALALLARGSKWDSISWILRGIMDADPRVADVGQKALHRWRTRFNRSFQSPSPEQLARVAAEVDAAADRIGHEMLRWLRGAVRPLG